MSEAPELYFRCPRCNRVSYNRNDIRDGWCLTCRDWTGKEKRPDEKEKETTTHD
jgi:uncharacterized C2H2 Zn-finger protein